MANSSNIHPAPPVAQGITSQSIQTGALSALDAAIAYEVANQHSSKIAAMMSELEKIKMSYNSQSIQTSPSKSWAGFHSMDSNSVNSVGGTLGGTTTGNSSSSPTTTKKEISVVSKQGTLTQAVLKKQSITTEVPPKKPSPSSKVKMIKTFTINSW